MATGARTITVLRTPRVDKLSAKSTADVPATDITKVVILPRQDYEIERGWVSVEGWDVWILPSSKVKLAGGATRRYADGDVLQTDTVLVDGVRWSVDGPVAPYDKGRTRKGTKVQLKRLGT